jgi:hypothetical protein
MTVGCSHCHYILRSAYIYDRMNGSAPANMQTIQGADECIDHHN